MIPEQDLIDAMTEVHSLRAQVDKSRASTNYWISQNVRQNEELARLLAERDALKERAEGLQRELDEAVAEAENADRKADEAIHEAVVLGRERDEAEKWANTMEHERDWERDVVQSELRLQADALKERAEAAESRLKEELAWDFGGSGARQLDALREQVEAAREAMPDGALVMRCASGVGSTDEGHALIAAFRAALARLDQRETE